jgi:hypothetical protein
MNKKDTHVTPLTSHASRFTLHTSLLPLHSSIFTFVMTLPEKLENFYFNLKIEATLPEGIEVMNPYEKPEVQKICSEFFSSFYAADHSRKLMLGINPGRFGAGITGITFTDPIRLEEFCDIKNPFHKKQELSSVFIYDMIQAFGSVESFYSRYFLSAVSPLGFIKNGKNLNYYDERKLQEALTPFIIDTLMRHISMGFSGDEVICLGEGKNYQFLAGLNREHKLFNKIIPLPHPRWIMQYRYRTRSDFIMKYIDVLK